MAKPRRLAPVLFIAWLAVALGSAGGPAFAQLVNPHVFRSMVDLGPYGSGGIFDSVVWKKMIYLSSDSDNYLLHSVDISDPDNIQYFSRALNVGGHCYQPVVVEDKLYVAAWYHCLKVFDISTPGIMNQIGSYVDSTYRYFWGLDASNNRVYATQSNNDTTRSLQIFDVTNPASPTLVKRFSLSQRVINGVAVRGSYAYVANYNHLITINISQEANPYVTDDKDLGHLLADVKMRDNYLYVSSEEGAGGLYIFDISNPSVPNQVKNLTGFAGLTMCLLGDYAFLAGSGTAVTTVRIYPLTPTVITATNVDSLTDAEVAYEYAISGNGRFIYIGDGEMYYQTEPPYNNYWVGKLYCFQAFNQDPDNEGPGNWSDFTPTEASWDAQYQGDALPTASDPPWSLWEGTEVWASISGGVLRINDTGTVLGDKVKWSRNWDATNTRGGTVLVRARCASYQLNGATIPNLIISDGRYNVEFAILSDKIRNNTSGAEYALDGTAWHTYRITTQGTQYQVYVDECATPVLTGALTQTGADARWPRVIFGAGSSYATQDIYFDYVYCCSNGAFGPSTATDDLTPDVSVRVADTAGKGSLSGIRPSTARVHWSTDGGATWQSSGGVDWDCDYNCDEMPTLAEPFWTVAEGSEVYGSVASGILRVNDNSTAGDTKVKWSRAWGSSAAVGATVFVRARCASVGGDTTYAGNIFIENGSRREVLAIMPDRIVAKEAGLTYMMDGSQWHIYRMTAKGTQFKVYVDENPTPVLTGTMGATTASNRVMFGSGASAGMQDIYFDYVRYTTIGDLPPGEGDGGGPVAVTCTGTYGTDRGVINAYGIPFNQYSETMNKVRFSLRDVNSNIGWSPVYNIRISRPLGPVTGFAAYGEDSQVRLEWTNPANPLFAGTMIRYKTTGYPTSPTDGSLVYEGPDSSFIHTGRTNGVRYYYSAFARDLCSQYTAAANASAHAAVDASIPTAKELADGQVRALRGKVVSAGFPGYFYVQEPDRSSGLRVISPDPVSEGQIVDVVGVMTTTGSERALDTAGNRVKLVAP